MDIVVSPPEFKLLRQLLSSSTRAEYVRQLLLYGEVAPNCKDQVGSYHLQILHQTHWCSTIRTFPRQFYLTRNQRFRISIAIEQILQWIQAVASGLDIQDFGTPTLNPLLAVTQYEHGYLTFLWLTAQFPDRADAEQVAKAIQSNVVSDVNKHLVRLVNAGLLCQNNGQFTLRRDCALVNACEPLTELLALAKP